LMGLEILGREPEILFCAGPILLPFCDLSTKDIVGKAQKGRPRLIRDSGDLRDVALRCLHIVHAQGDSSEDD